LSFKNGNDGLSKRREVFFQELQVRATELNNSDFQTKVAVNGKIVLTK